MLAKVWHFTEVLSDTLITYAEFAATFAERVDRDGAGPGSLTDEGLHYSVVDGVALQSRSPALAAWIEARIPPLASAATGIALKLSPHVPSAININVIEGIGGSYEPHTDSCPFTMILFCGDGGGPLCLSLDGGVVACHPAAGAGVLFHGYSIPHWVEPMTVDDRRISIPVALYPTAVEVERDPELDGHLYV